MLAGLHVSLIVMLRKLDDSDLSSRETDSWICISLRSSPSIAFAFPVFAAPGVPAFPQVSFVVVFLCLSWGERLPSTRMF